MKGTRHALGLLTLVSALWAQGSIGGDLPGLPTGEEILRRSPDGIRFAQACEPGPQTTVAAVGDVLLHRVVQLQTFTAGDRATGLWKDVADLLQRTDITYANLEGPTAHGVNKADKDVPDPVFVFDNEVYSGLPNVNYHPSILAELLAAGIDIVSTGNNHALDRGPLGLERTIDALENAGLDFAGTRKRMDTAPDWYTVTESNRIRIAWISCTFQNRRNPDPSHLVLQCYNDEDLIQGLIGEIVQGKKADAVFVAPHWGEQFVHVPDAEQIRVARKFLEAGALAILGAHPHVIQPWERVITSDGRETFVIYSLGNFVSGHKQLPRRATVLLNLGLTRTASGRVILNGVRYTPLLMTHDEDRYAVQAIARYPRRDSVEAVEAENLLLGILGASNLAPPDAPLVTNPECAAMKLMHSTLR